MKKIFRIIVFLILILGVLFFVNKDKILKSFYPIKYSEYVEKYAKEYNVDKYLIYATIKAESNFDENAKSGKGAIGLMQIMYSTAEDIAESLNLSINGEKDIFIPDVNIKFGVKYLSWLLNKYDGCIELALAGYNAGSGKVDGWINDGTLNRDGSNVENIPYKETKNYVKKITKDYKIYKELYKQEG